MRVKKRLICFDLDNTLIHSSKAHIMAFQKALKKHGYNNITNKQLKSKFGVASRIYLKEFLPNASNREITSIRNLHDKYLITLSKKYVHKIRGMMGALRELKKDYRFALVTNCNKKDVDIFLKILKLNKKLFDKIIYSTEKLKPKPAPDSIKKAERLLHQKAMLMVGDTTYDIIAARKANVKCIAVTSGFHSYSKLKKEKPYAILKSVKDLPKFLKTNHHLF
jgi:pyrophosphatase PpaX